MVEKKYKMTVYETVFLSIVILDIIAYFYYIYGLIDNKSLDEALRNYYLNNGIKVIATITFIFQVTFAVPFILSSLFKRFKDNIYLKITYFISAIATGLIKWFEIYYGSTFYYGEVRDKQGLHIIAIFGTMCFIFAVFKLNYSKTKQHNLLLKAIIASIIIIISYKFYFYVYDLWDLKKS